MTERLEDMEAVKEYLNLLERGENAYLKAAFMNIFHEMNHLKNNVGMMTVDMEDMLKKAAMMPESKEKDIVSSALEKAAEGVQAARKFYLQAESIILKGMEVSVTGFRYSGIQVSGKPFPILKTEKELEGIMKALVDSFAAIDRAIGKIEDEKGLLCAGGRYRDAESGCCLGDGDKRLELLAVLWPMRMAQNFIRQTHDAAYETAKWVDTIRPKGHRIIKKDTLEPGIFCRKDKLRMELETKHLEMPPKEEKPRVSLRKRLETAKTDCKRSGTPALENEYKVAELDL